MWPNPENYEINYMFTLYELVNFDPYGTVNRPLSSLLSGSSITYTEPTHAEDVWKIIYARHYQDYVIRSASSTIAEADKRSFFVKVCNIFELTKVKYEEMLTLYSSETSKLMDKISTTGSTVTRFNDTPQDGGSFDDDEHTTNITEGTSTGGTDADSKMNRIDEVQAKYRNLLAEWASEFDKIFIEEV